MVQYFNKNLLILGSRPKNADTLSLQKNLQILFSLQKVFLCLRGAASQGRSKTSGWLTGEEKQIQFFQRWWFQNTFKTTNISHMPSYSTMPFCVHEVLLPSRLRNKIYIWMADIGRKSRFNSSNVGGFRILKGSLEKKCS